MKDYQKLEDAIYKAWQVSEDIDLLFKHYYDAPQPMTEDELANALIGIKTLSNMRFAELHDTYCRVFELDQYCTDPEKLAARDQLFAMITPNKKGKKKK